MSAPEEEGAGGGGGCGVLDQKPPGYRCLNHAVCGNKKAHDGGLYCHFCTKRNWGVLTVAFGDPETECPVCTEPNKLMVRLPQCSHRVCAGCFLAIMRCVCADPPKEGEVIPKPIEFGYDPVEECPARDSDDCYCSEHDLCAFAYRDWETKNTHRLQEWMHSKANVFLDRMGSGDVTATKKCPVCRAFYSALESKPDTGECLCSAAAVYHGLGLFSTVEAADYNEEAAPV